MKRKRMAKTVQVANTNDKACSFTCAACQTWSSNGNSNGNTANASKTIVQSYTLPIRLLARKREKFIVLWQWFASTFYPFLHELCANVYIFPSSNRFLYSTFNVFIHETCTFCSLYSSHLNRFFVFLLFFAMR